MIRKFQTQNHWSKQFKEPTLPHIWLSDSIWKIKIKRRGVIPSISFLQGSHVLRFFHRQLWQVVFQFCNMAAILPDLLYFKLRSFAFLMLSLCRLWCPWSVPRRLLFLTAICFAVCLSLPMISFPNSSRPKTYSAFHNKRNAILHVRTGHIVLYQIPDKAIPDLRGFPLCSANIQMTKSRLRMHMNCPSADTCKEQGKEFHSGSVNWKPALSVWLPFETGDCLVGLWSRRN